MKKANVKQILLIAFAVIAVYTACMPGSVAVYNLEQSTEPFYCTYFALVEDVTGNICLPAAALCACVTLLLGGIYVTMKKTHLLSTLKIFAMAGAILAVVPILIKDSAIMLVPNMLVPIALLGEYVTAYYLQKQTQKQAVAAPLTGKRRK